MTVRKEDIEREEWTQLARFSNEKTEFGLDDVVQWLSANGYKHEVKSGPAETKEVYVLAKPTDIRNQYSKECYSRQQENLLKKRPFK